MNEHVILLCLPIGAVLLLLGAIGGFLYTHLVGLRHRYCLRSVTVGYLHTEFATAKLCNMAEYLSNFDDDFEYEGRPYRVEPEDTEEELLERRMQKQREELYFMPEIRSRF